MSAGAGWAACEMRLCVGMPAAAAAAAVKGWKQEAQAAGAGLWRQIPAFIPSSSPPPPTRRSVETKEHWHLAICTLKQWHAPLLIYLRPLLPI